MEIPELATKAKTIEVATFAEVKSVEKAFEAYQADLISFTLANKLNCAQLVLIVFTPIVGVAYMIGNHLAH